MIISDALKLALNSVYGKSNDKYSFLYDPKYTMQTTLNGQLMLAMLIEGLTNIKSLEMIQANTDGITVKLHKNDIKQYYDICNKWSMDTQLDLEYVEYSKMIIRDVNNYIAVSTKGKVKYKGAFEIKKELHKDNSFMIIPLALADYFINNTSIEHSIMNHSNIYDFCGRQKFVGEDYGETHEVLINEKGPYNNIEKQQKNVRYYISKPGKTFIKQYKKGSSSFINKGYQVTIFNKYQEKYLKDYNINYDFYIKECYKEIDLIIDKQLELF